MRRVTREMKVALGEPLTGVEEPLFPVACEEEEVCTPTIPRAIAAPGRQGGGGKGERENGEKREERERGREGRGEGRKRGGGAREESDAVRKRRRAGEEGGVN